MPTLDGRVQGLRDDRRRYRTQGIAPWSHNALGTAVTANTGSVAYPTANKALFYPFIIEDEAFTVREAWMESVANSSGHVDWGIYDHTYTKVVTVGSTVWTSASDIQVAAVTPTKLVPGRYYAAFAADSTGVGVRCLKDGSGNGSLFRMMGCVAKTTAFALPAGTVTPATYGDDCLPFFGFSGQVV